MTPKNNFLKLDISLLYAYVCKTKRDAFVEINTRKGGICLEETGYLVQICFKVTGQGLTKVHVLQKKYIL